MEDSYQEFSPWNGDDPDPGQEESPILNSPEEIQQYHIKHQALLDRLWAQAVEWFDGHPVEARDAMLKDAIKAKHNPEMFGNIPEERLEVFANIFSIAFQEILHRSSQRSIDEFDAQEELL